MEKSTLILGPPGCGKTHTLMNVVRDALARGISPWQIGFLSFTRKAVTEAAERAAQEFGFSKKDTPYFKTLHALGFHLLGLKRDDVMRAADWKAFSDELGMELSTNSPSFDDLSAAFHTGLKSGDLYLRMIERAAMREVPIEQEYREFNDSGLSFPMLRKFDQLLDVYRRELQKVTFTDMLRMFVEIGEAPRLKLLIIDEAQDLVPLQWRMVAKLMENADEVYFAGDDDQAIHRWAGVEVQKFLSCSPNIQVLEQSYRLPRSVFDLSQRVVHRIRERVPKAYRPVDRGGRVSYHPGRDYLDLTRGSWTLMARANYMAQEWGETLRDEGYLFSLNGVRSIREDLTTSLEILNDLQRGGSIYSSDIKKLYGQTDPKMLHRGAKKLIEAADPQARYDLSDLQSNFGFMASEVQDPMTVLKVTDREKTYIRALNRRGEDVTKQPRIKVGTIHANKGGEDDNVAVDLGSTRSAVESRYPDDEHRVFYVGLTRAKNNLHVIESGKRYRYEL